MNTRWLSRVSALGVLVMLGGVHSALAQKPAAAQTPKPAAAVDASKLPKAKQTTLGLYVTAAQAYEMWKASPEKVKVIDVRTPEEFAFVGHPQMAWNIPLAFVTYESKGGKFVYGTKPNTAFVEQVRALAKPGDVLLLTCRSGGRGAMAVNALAAAGFTSAYNIVDGIEGDLVEDPDSVYFGKRMKNGWKNSAPWGYTIDPEKIILAEGASSRKK
jgi:rhodanese-related sulfurtransferase